MDDDDDDLPPTRRPIGLFGFLIFTIIMRIPILLLLQVDLFWKLKQKKFHQSVETRWQAE